MNGFAWLWVRAQAYIKFSIIKEDVQNVQRMDLMEKQKT